MNERTFVIIEDRKLPVDKLKVIKKKKKRYGYVNIFFLLGVIFVFSMSFAIIVLKGWFWYGK